MESKLRGNALGATRARDGALTLTGRRGPHVGPWNETLQDGGFLPPLRAPPLRDAPARAFEPRPAPRASVPAGAGVSCLTSRSSAAMRSRSSTFSASAAAARVVKFESYRHQFKPICSALSIEQTSRRI